MALPHAVDTTNPDEVYRHVIGVFSSHGWRESEALMQILFRDIARLFRGEWPGYMACDMRYHDFQHTLQATVCIVDLVDGQHRAGATPHLDRREAEKAVAAALLHDSGFIKRTHEPAGTGAKYTFVHEQRSCEFARAYLPTIGFAPAEVDDVCAAIGCTGPRNRISTQTFSGPTNRLIACMLVTADYLAQLAAADYPDELDILYAEFAEAYDHENLPPEKRLFKSARDLKQKTPDFWEKYARPMLDTEADGVHRYLTVTGQPNFYLQAVEANIAEIRRRLQAEMAQI
ncbi:MAG: hypothetical protein NDI75_10390 [Candidatus Didemnitutus sp.]|jgi:hypothetical protein|nr:hypothetical protein [Candidatus Didemnitutus sp.]